MGERMRGPHVEDELSAFLDDELDEATALVVTRHLARCEGCVAELEELRVTRSALRALPHVEPPTALLLGATLHAPDADRLSRGVRTAALLALAAAAVVAGAFVAGEEAGTVRPPVDMFVVDHVARTGGGPVITPVRFDPTGR
jgi:anti-sigma factor RsiW